MTKEMKNLGQVLHELAKFADRGELDDLPIGTYRNLRSASRSALRWHENNYPGSVHWGCLVLIGAGLTLGSFLYFMLY